MISDFRGIPRHFDNFFSKMDILIFFQVFVQIWLMELSWSLISTVTISTRFELRFLSYSLRQFSVVGLQRYFRRQNGNIY